MLCTNGCWTLGVLLGGLGCELGHMFPAYYGLKGGKGILSGGVLVWMLDWRIALVSWSLFLLLWLLTRYVSLGSVVGTASMPFTAFFVFDHDPLLTALCALVAALVIYCHRENIRRLLKGTERKFRWHVNPISPDESDSE